MRRNCPCALNSQGNQFVRPSGGDGSSSISTTWHPENSGKMTITVDELLITEALQNRPARRRDLAREIKAINDLARGMVRQPDALQRRFVELALDLCRAGSAGISMLEEGEHGQPLFRWTALAGEFAPYIGGTTPRHFSPCGLCLDRDTVILVSRPARLFEYFNEASAQIGRASCRERVYVLV